MADKKTSKSTATKKTKTQEEALEVADITVEIEPPKAFTVNLGGMVYNARPIKGSYGVALTQEVNELREDPQKMKKYLEDVVSLVFKEEASKILKRLYSPNDNLDFPHIIDLVQKLTEKATGNPTM